MSLSELTGQFDFDGRILKIGDGVSNPDAVTVRQLRALETALQGQLDIIFGNRPLEERFVVPGGGQTVFDATTITWIDDNTEKDISVYVNGDRQDQDELGGAAQDFKKNSATQIEFSYTLPENAKVIIRSELPAIIAEDIATNPYFVAYITGETDNLIEIGQQYDIGDAKLGVYRNGLYLTDETSLILPPINFYYEFDNVSVILGLAANANEVIEFVHQLDIPTSRVTQTSLTGTVLTVPTYATGTDRLRVYRNGMLMNAAGLGDLTDQYVETSPTSITLSVAATSDEYFTFEQMALTPDFRDDQDGATGTTITVPAYTMGDDRLLIFRNGLLMHNDGTGDAITKYVEASVTTITLTTAALASEVFTAIYK
jgi:hypothetical protein